MGIRSILETKPVRVLFQDEARFGRINDPRHCWAGRGIRPIVHKQIIRQYTYVYGAFSPMDGAMDSLILPDMYTGTMNVFLKEVSLRHPDELILMVMDGAPCHRSGLLEVPPDMEILRLPPYCPQLNPSENMWDEIREKAFANRSFRSMDHLEDHLCKTLQIYENNPETVQSISQWKWIADPIHSFFIAS